MSITMISLGLVEYRHTSNKTPPKRQVENMKRGPYITTKVDTQYLDVLSTTPQTSRQIADALGRTIKAVQGHMIKLEKRGLVTMLGYRKGRSNPAKLWAVTNAKA